MRKVSLERWGAAFALALAATMAGAAAWAPAQESPEQPPKQPPQQQGGGGGRDVSDPAMWDKIFGAPKPRYRTEPNDFLDRVTKRLAAEGWQKGGTAIDLAAGDGRNALLLAAHGYAVTAIDISKVGLEKARATAAEKKLTLDCRESDLYAFDYGKEQWDLLSVIYFNPAMSIADRLKASVKPGGVIVIEGQGSEHQGGGPPKESLFRPNELLKTFGDWRILAYEDGRFESDWNLGKPTHVVRLMARKPPAK